MKFSLTRSICRAGVVVLAAVALSSCSMSFGADAVPQSELEKDVSKLLNEQTGEDNEAACDGDLEAEEDATQDCFWKSKSLGKVKVEVTATSINDDEVEYQMKPITNEGAGGSS